MKPEIRSRTQEPVGVIAAQARQMPDQVERLRYLQGRITIASRINWRGIQVWPPGKAVIAVVSGATALGVAILAWRAF